MTWDPDKDLERIRQLFPILESSVYLISNSLGAVPARSRDELDRYFSLWAERGVSAWHDEWWDLARGIGDRVGGLIGAERDTVTMLTHATQAHWTALSTCFGANSKGRDRIVMTDQDFPSSIYALTRLARSLGWRIDMVESGGRPGIDVERILERIDERTLFVATSHVYFKSAYVQDIAAIAAHARRFGALTLIDGYHGPGTLPVDVTALGVDFYVGGCLKWLCGGPGNAFLYAAPGTTARLEPALTGWLAHRNPFRFETAMDFTEGACRFMSGTPPVACLYAARPGLEILRDIGPAAVRSKSLRQTGRLMELADARGFVLDTPREPARRGGAVSIGVPHALQVKRALEDRSIKADFRKGQGGKPDVIRVGPHFYTRDNELEIFFEAVDELLASEDYRRYSAEIDHVT